MSRTNSAAAVRASSCGESESRALVPFADVGADGRPFGRLVAVACSALLALLLAWRFLLFPSSAAHQRQSRGASSERDDERRAKVDGHNKSSPSEMHCGGMDDDGSGGADDDNLRVAEATNSADECRHTSLSSLRLLLPCDRIPHSQMDDDDGGGGGGGGDDDDARSQSSSSSEPDGDALPPFLDTITEEDTDDLISHSSGRVYSASPPFGSPTQLRSPFHLMQCRDSEEAVEVGSEMPINANQNHLLATEGGGDSWAGNREVEECNALLGVSIYSLDGADEPDKLASVANNAAAAAADNTRAAEERGDRLNPVDSPTPNDNGDARRLFCSAARQLDSSAPTAAAAATGEQSGAADSPPPPLLAGIDAPNTNAAMDIDLTRTMRRFERYGQVYGDAPLSRVEELRPPTTSPPPSPTDFGGRVSQPTSEGRGAITSSSPDPSLTPPTDDWPIIETRTERTVQSRQTVTEETAFYSIRRSVSPVAPKSDSPPVSRGPSKIPTPNSAPNNNNNPPEKDSPKSTTPKAQLLPSNSKIPHFRIVHNKDRTSASSLPARAPIKVTQLPTKPTSVAAPRPFVNTWSSPSIISKPSSTRPGSIPIANGSAAGTPAIKATAAKEVYTKPPVVAPPTTIQSEKPSSAEATQAKYPATPLKQTPNARELDSGIDFKTTPTTSSPLSAMSDAKPQPRPRQAVRKAESPVADRKRPLEHVQTHVGHQPEPQRIDPPTKWRTDKPKYGVVLPRYFSSSEHLHQLLDDPYYEKEKRKAMLMFPSSEHLQELTKEPYFARGRSKETLFATDTNSVPLADYKSKEKRSLVLSQENLARFSTMPENKENSRQHMMRWRESMHLEGGELPQENVGGARPATSAASVGDASTTAPRERIYTQRRLPDEEGDNFSRSSRRSSHRYRAKIEKARRDFVQAPAPTAPSPEQEEMDRRFQRSMDELRRPAPDWRGPLLQKFHSGEFDSKADLSALPPTKYGRAAPSPHDNEYRRLVAAAERQYAAYRHRLSAPNLYARSRAYSAGYLTETNVDTGLNETVPRDAYLEETDMDDVHERSRVRSGDEPPRAASAAAYRQHQSRSRTKEPQPLTRVDPQHRARSVDYLMDQRAREETEPPENQLKKILGDASDRNLSQHELRFRQSVDKLHVPDWYLNSEFCPAGKFDDRFGSRSSMPRYVHDPNASSYARTPQTPETHTAAQTPVSVFERPLTAQSNYQYLRDGERQPATQPIEQTRYTSPWTYGGRFSGRATATPTSAERPPTVPPPAPPTQPRKGAPDIPTGFFDRYKEEIEELRLSRTSLHQIAQTPDANSVPVATVKPRLFGDQEKWSSSMSDNTSPSPARIPSAYFDQQQMRQEANLMNMSDEIVTSTPYGSSQMPRKAQHQPMATASKPAPPARPSTLQTQPVAEMNHHNSSVQQTTTTTTERVIERHEQSAYAQQQYGSERPQPKPRTLGPRLEPTPPQPQPVVLREAPAVQQHHNYTVSTVPPEWNDARNRNSRVIEVTDTFVGVRRTADAAGNISTRFGGRVTLDEVLDSMLRSPAGDQKRRLSPLLDESSSSLNSSMPHIEPRTPSAPEGPSIYTKNYMLMERCIKSPDMAEELLKNETMLIRCASCMRTHELNQARTNYVSCRHCYVYYCSRNCRQNDWYRHKDRCTFARVNTVCKEIIMKVREDPEAQWQMSRVARQGFETRGRGSVNFRFRSLALAEAYMAGGWTALVQNPGNYLYFYTVPDLVDNRKEPSLIALCRRYDPRAKFILSVSIVADIDECPQTPPSSARPTPQPTPQPAPVQPTPQRREPQQQFQRTQSLPHRYRKHAPEAAAPTDEPDAKMVLRSVLRSLENIAPDAVQEERRPSTSLGQPRVSSQRLAAPTQRDAPIQRDAPPVPTIV